VLAFSALVAASNIAVTTSSVAAQSRLATD
jgi:hypothetical protein